MKANLPAIILGVAIVVAALIYALSTRYELVQTRTGGTDLAIDRPIVLDRWTGKTQ
jgi:hypothetical protein